MHISELLNLHAILDIVPVLITLSSMYCMKMVVGTWSLKIILCEVMFGMCYCNYVYNVLQNNAMNSG